MRNSFTVALAAVVVSCFAGAANAVTVAPPTSGEISATYDLTVNAAATQVSFGNDGKWVEFVFTVAPNVSDTLGIVAQGNNTVNFDYNSFISPSTYESALSGDANTPFSLSYAGGVSGTTYDVYIADGVDPTVDVQLTNLATTPLPAALPMFAGGLGVVGFLARRKKRKTVAGA